MFHTYEEALEWIHGRLRLGIKPGLKRMEWMMEKLNHPERNIKTIHVGGTNGKGSTVTYLRCILESSGYKVGTFTSPYFEHFNERISVNGKPFSEQDLITLTNMIKPLSDELEDTDLGGPTEFEVITAMSFYYFAHMNPVDIVIYEVGLGGRFDSTNIIYPLVSIITSIGLDHTNILGNTYGEIAFEKAGIIKNGVSVLSAVKQPEALEVIKRTAAERKAPFYLLGEQFSVDDHQSTIGGETFSIQTVFQSLQTVEISMIGKHQTENAALAIMAVQVLNNFYSFLISEQDIRAGLKRAYWPGRFEVLSSKPMVVIDGAHNEEGIRSLVAELSKRYKDKKIKMIFAGLHDKKLDNMVSQLDKIADKITFIDFDYPRAAKAEQIFELSSSKNKRIASDWHIALVEEISGTTEEDVLVITGTLYFLSEAKPSILKILRN